MLEYIKNFKSKLKSNQEIAGNQLVFKEKEALVITGVLIGVPVFVILIAFIMM